MPINYNFLLAFTYSAAALVVFAVLVRKPWLPNSRRRVIGWGVVWCLLVTMDYWIVGPYSFALLISDLDQGVTVHRIVSAQPPGTRFIHSFAGGSDFFGATLINGQYLSLERMLLANFPLWIAFFFQKMLVAGVNLAGTYRVCRALKTDRTTAFAMGALVTLGHFFLTQITWIHGLGYSLIPWVFYLAVQRQDKRWYWTSMIVVAALYTISSTATHSALALFFTVPAAALLLGNRPFFRAIPALCLVLGVVLLNWHETLYAMISLGPYSSRAAATFAASSLLGFVQIVYHIAWTQLGAPLLALVGGLIAIALTRPSDLTRILILSVLCVLAGPLMNNVPWEMVPRFAFLKGYNFLYLDYGLPLIATVVVALGSRGLLDQGGNRFRRSLLPPLAAVLMALAAGRFTEEKAFESLNWLHQGGQQIVEDTDGLISPTWLPKDPVRVVSFTHRLPLNLTAMAGLDAIDGNYNVSLKNFATFWIDGINKGRGVEGLLTTQNIEMCCRRYDITQFADVDFLRIANVGFLASRLPVGGGGLVQVAGPTDRSVPPRSDTPLWEKLTTDIKLITKPPPLRVYALPKSITRIFPVEAVTPVSDTMSDKEFLAEVKESALAGKAVVRQRDFRPMMAAVPKITLSDFAKVKNGFDVNLEDDRGGLLGVNVTYVPFWKAMADGKDLPMVSANGVHSLVIVPAGVRKVEIRYDRPLLRDAMKQRWKALW